MSLIRYLLLVIVVVAGLSGCSAVKLSLKNTPTLANAMGVAEIPERDLRREYVNRDSRFVEVNGFNIHYRDEGNPDGPVIVLLHGIMSSLHTWDDWTAGLGKDYRVIRLDVPGYGLTGIPDDFDVDQMDDALLISTFERFIDELELKRFSLAGNSLGGYISAMYAARHPEKVEKLILLDPVAYPQELPWLFHLATAPVISQLSQFVLPPWAVTLGVQEVYGDPKRLKNEHVKRYIYMSQRHRAKEAYARTLQMLKEASDKERPLPFGNIKAPTLIMWGKLDRWVPVRLAERWKQDIPNAEVRIYEDAGHVPMEEIPEDTLKDALAFLDSGQLIDAPSQEPSVDDLESILKGEEIGSDLFAPLEGVQ
ncbi:alpha/beta hydrolase [Hahella sp. SMD15-11]|uniref:Alpha/beta hydrolase n=1 Tax=Thermohahella caldifontis TaxID=3142973 RepID=A0AB39UYQ4_9GAMM